MRRDTQLPQKLRSDEQWSVDDIGWKSMDEYGFSEMTDFSLDERQRAETLHQKIKWKEQYETKASKQSGYWNDWLNRHQVQEIGLLNRKSKMLVRRGIPSSSRRQVWLAELHVLEKIELNKGLYSELIGKAETVGEDVIKVIEKDLHRTFPNHPLFSTESGLKQLRNILVAFSVKNPVIGYCQSMNYIAGFLLIFLREEEAFWTFIEIVENILPSDFYSTSLLGAHIDLSVLKILLKERSKRLARHFEKHDVDISVVCMSWFLCLFVNTLPVETCLRVWDVFFLEKSKILFRVAIALFKMHESELLQCNDAGQIYKKLSSMGSTCFDCDALLKTAFYRIGSLRRSHIEKLRSTQRPLVQARHDQIEEKRNLYRESRTR